MCTDQSTSVERRDRRRHARGRRDQRRDQRNVGVLLAWDTLNGALNGSLSIASGACGIFIKVDNGVTQDWRAAVIS